jgi:hypothetical protein
MNEQHRTLIASIVSVCDRATIDMGNGVENAIKNIIVISLRYVDRKVLLEQVLPDLYVDWEYVDEAHTLLGNKRNILGDSDIWLELLPYLHFGKMDMSPLELKISHPTLWVLYNTLEKCVSQNTRFDDACKLFLLSNLMGVPFKYASERYISKQTGASSQMVCMKIIEAMAEERHGADVYLKSMKYLIENCVVSKESMDRHLSYFRSNAAELKNSFRLKHLSVKCRPSMIAMLASKQSTSGSTTGSLSATIETDGLEVVTFSKFCDSTRFPNCMSHLLRIRCYLLACQSHNFDYTAFTEKFVASDIANVMNSTPIATPHIQTLDTAIASLSLNIHPFPELRQFRTICFTGYAESQVRFCVTCGNLFCLFDQA